MSEATTYLLADHTLVAQAFAMRRRPGVPEPVRSDPVLPCAQAYGSVLCDPESGLFRMWYLGDTVYSEYFATSENGIGWDLPDLGILPPDERGNRNAFMTNGQNDANGYPLVGNNGPEGFSVLDAEMEDHPAAKARFTALYLAGVHEGVSGLCIAYSDDGIHWTADQHNPVVHGWMDTSHSLVWDPDIRRYVVYGRPPVRASVVRGANRYVSRMESENLIHWSPCTTALNTDDADADPWDQFDEGSLTGAEEPKVRGPNRQFYGMSVSKQHGLYIGLARMFDVPSGAGWIELTHSTDGIEWTREPLREPFIAPRPGTWEHPMLLTTVASPPVPVGDDLWIYYGGVSKPHHGKATIEERGIGVGKIGTDRWAGYHSAEHEAELLTRPIPSGSRLTLNASTQPDGWIRVEVIDPHGAVLDGCSLEESATISGDSLAHEVRWTGTDRIAGTSPSIRLRIRSAGASVWAFTMQD
jgi:hypothetical protein